MGHLSSPLSACFFFRINKFKSAAVFDILAVTVTLVQGFGKIGCFMAGCCHGKVCSASFGVTFTHLKSQAPLNRPLYPVQLIDAAIIFSCLILILMFRNRPYFSGKLMLVYGIVYGSGRFITEFLRGDEGRGYWGALSQSQWISIAIVGICLYFFFKKSALPTHRK